MFSGEKPPLDNYPEIKQRLIERAYRVAGAVTNVLRFLNQLPFRTLSSSVNNFNLERIFVLFFFLLNFHVSRGFAVCFFSLYFWTRMSRDISGCFRHLL